MITHHSYLVSLLCLALLPATLAAQGPGDGRYDGSPFGKLELPAPNEYRAATGAPGPAYWQQRADYTIRATLDTASETISGSETIRYRNNSPDSLTYLWLHVEQNLYRPDSEGSYVHGAETRFAARGFAGGMEVASASANGVAVDPKLHGTRLRLDLPEPLRPGEAVELGFEFSFTIPEHGSDRMGREGDLYQLAQWYPRMAVYDDVSGWNAEPYLGLGEFYLEYGDFDLRLTVPAGFVVAATGTLENPGDVLTGAQRERLERARRSEQPVAIITAEEAGTAAARPRTDGTLTWHFRARNVRDVSWAASPEFLWDAGSTRGTLCQALYEPDAAEGWRSGAEMTCFSVRRFSEMWFPYPYPQATSIAGPVGGMEYPMIVFVHADGSERSVFSTINHEHGHQWFPMIVGSNERLYFWMDEGLNTFIYGFTMAERYPDRDPWTRYRAAYDTALASGLELPPHMQADRIPLEWFGVLSYRKPAMALRMLRQNVLGPERFDRAFREYIRRWAFRHPQPADFFRTMEEASGEELDWFFYEWLYTNDTLDQSVAGVAQFRARDGYVAVIRLRTRPGVVMPVDLQLELEDGRTREVHLPVQVWYYGPEYTYRLGVPSPLVRVEVDPDGEYPDQDRLNNVWRRRSR